jgi:hypothetical protein
MKLGKSESLAVIKNKKPVSGFLTHGKSNEQIAL